MPLLEGRDAAPPWQDPKPKNPLNGDIPSFLRVATGGQFNDCAAPKPGIRLAAINP